MTAAWIIDRSMMVDEGLRLHLKTELYKIDQNILTSAKPIQFGPLRVSVSICTDFRLFLAKKVGAILLDGFFQKSDTVHRTSTDFGGISYEIGEFRKMGWKNRSLPENTQNLTPMGLDKNR